MRQNKRKNTAQHGQRARMKTKISTEANTLHLERQTMCGEDQERENILRVNILQKCKPLVCKATVQTSDCP